MKHDNPVNLLETIGQMTTPSDVGLVDGLDPKDLVSEIHKMISKFFKDNVKQDT